jgi:hypothetical protein
VFIREREVRAAVAEILDRDDERALQPEHAGERDEGGRDRPQPAEQRDEEEREEREQQVDDERDREEVAPLAAVLAPRLAEDLGRAHGATLRHAAAVAQSPYRAR